MCLYPDRGKNRITNFLRVRDLILAVVEIPNIQESVHSRQEEQAWAGWRPAAIRQISLMVSSLHYRVEHTFLTPHLSLPIANTHEVLVDKRVTF